MLEFNGRIAYLMGRRLLYALCIGAIAICVIAAFFGFVYICFSTSVAMFGTAAYGFIPFIIAVFAIMCYPLAVSDYRDEIKRQEEIAERLSRDDSTHWRHKWK